MPGKHLYSAAHDASQSPSPKKRRSRKVAALPPKAPPMFAPGQAMQPTEEQRRELRARQLKAAIPDPDLIKDHRRVYEVDGETTHSEPRHRSPHPYGLLPGDRRLITLPDDPDTELTEEEKAQQLQEMQLMQQQGVLPLRFAALVDDNSPLKKLGDQIQHVNTSLGNLRATATALKSSGQGSPALQHHADQILLIIAEAMQPWLREIDDHAAGIVEDTDMESSTNQLAVDDDEHPMEDIA